MPKFVNDAMLDLVLSGIANAGDKLFICSAYPATYAEASSTYKLGGASLTPGAGNGVYAIGNGSVSGRKLTIAQQVGVAITAAGSATHIAICDSSGQRVLLVTTVTETALNSGNAVTVNVWSYTTEDPT